MNLAEQFNPVNKPSHKRNKPLARTRGAKETIKVLTCHYCGIVYERTLGQYNGQFTKHYCSDKCTRLAKRNRVNLICKQCGCEFERSLSRISKFCKQSCWFEWNKLNPRLDLMVPVDNSGKNNGQYKHGRYVGKGRAGGSATKEKVRKQVIERDKGNWCFICGKPGPGMHLHRIVYGAQCGKYEVNNCIQLCFDHHAVIHSNKKEWQPKLLLYIASRLEDGN